MEVQNVRWKYLYCCYFSSQDDEFVDKRNEQVKKEQRSSWDDDLPKMTCCVYITLFSFFVHLLNTT